MDVHFCPACGTSRREGAVFCITCGNRLLDDLVSSSIESDDIFGPPPTLTSGIIKSAGAGSASALITTLVTARIITALSPIFAVLYLNDFWLFSSDLPEIWIVSVWIPALMTLIPLLGSRKFLGISGDDARFVLLSAVTALFVALRSTGALLEPSLPDDGYFILSQILGLAGFVVVGISFPWKKSARSWFAESFHPVHIAVASLAAVVFLVMRERGSAQFLFSHASISGPSVFEYVFLAVLVSVGFLRAPWRQFVALPIASFSIMSFIANVLFAEGPVHPWPNPVTFACCIALCFPWESSVDDKKLTF